MTDYQAEAERMARDAATISANHRFPYAVMANARKVYVEETTKILLEQLPLVSLIAARCERDEFERVEPKKRADMAETRKQLFRLTDLISSDVKKEDWTTERCVDWLVANYVHASCNAENEAALRTALETCKGELADRVRQHKKQRDNCDRLIGALTGGEKVEGWADAIDIATKLRAENLALREVVKAAAEVDGQTIKFEGSYYIAVTPELIDDVKKALTNLTNLGIKLT